MAFFNSPNADSMVDFFSAGILSPYSVICFSVLNTNASAAFTLSASSLRFASDSAFISASFFIFSMSSLLKPLEASIRIFCSFPVALSFACTLKIPLASMSNVTSICGPPLGEGGMLSKMNLPMVLLSLAIGRSP